ncbi:MAG: OmpA family protein [Deltaproteobacteria bacterium]|nr:OmpA family protein [Deltaproteobacteria bacterium]
MRATFIAALFATGIATAVLGCGVPQEKYDADIAALKAEIQKGADALVATEQKLAELRNEKDALDRELKAVNAEMTRLANEASANAKAMEQAKRRLDTFKNMLSKFKAMIESGKIKVKVVRNRMVVEMASNILFPSGKAELSDEGKVALTEVAKILSTITDRSFQVAGHTDNVPIENSKRFRSNWDLSTARAVAVVDHLIANGMAMEQLSAAGYAETQPVASNDTEEGKAQNRRIEIVLLPNLDELPDLSSLEEMTK